MGTSLYLLPFPSPNFWKSKANVADKTSKIIRKWNYRILPPSWPRHVGQHVNLGRQDEHTRWPAWHWNDISSNCKAFSEEIQKILGSPGELEVIHSRNRLDIQTGMPNLDLADCCLVPYSLLLELRLLRNSLLWLFPKLQKWLDLTKNFSRWQNIAHDYLTWSWRGWGCR